MGTRKSYSKEFKVNAVRMISEEGRRASEVARDLGISYNMLHNWKRKLQEDHEEAFPGHGKLKPNDDYILKLERENKRLKDERDILKKAAIFFAKEP
jgi:transposase